MKKALVTGSSSGLGRAAVEALAATGWRVFAAVRDPADAEGVAALSDLVSAVEIDVTDEASIAAAAEKVREETGGELDGLVCNAGIPIGGALEAVEPADLRRIFDVNVVGVVATAQAFLPMLRAARGRIVIVGSLGGRVAFPFAAPYHATKFALEGIADSLRVELRPQGVGVALVEPAAFDTQIWAKAREQVAAQRAGLDDERRALYDERLGEFEDTLRSAEKNGGPPDEAGRKIADALDGSGTRYPVGRGARALSTIRPLLPDSLFDRIAGKVT